MLKELDCVIHMEALQKIDVVSHMSVYLPCVYLRVLAGELEKCCCVYRPASVIRIDNAEGKTSQEHLQEYYL